MQLDAARVTNLPRESYGNGRRIARFRMLFNRYSFDGIALPKPQSITDKADISSYFDSGSLPDPLRSRRRQGTVTAELASKVWGRCLRAVVRPRHGKAYSR